jgi:hypothetical protein
MHASPERFYSENSAIWILCDVTDAEGAEALHRLRAFFQADADLRAFGPEHFVLVVKPGAARRLAA